MRAITLLLASLSLMPVLQGCGQKGDLYLPEPDASSRSEAPADGQPAREDDDTDQ
ncbi:lipoprotein [Marinobacter salinisoli]|uniref:Lipoprotein n=1 Tax=Marinobacter salinisoli TaxID=2769486 RepID=A0ABX7MU28_9GAMM|nr:lipoprotein [Marinobacter salinisoli]QSP95880.1 lipoprotein [Marinobacter salinisoli]